MLAFIALLFAVPGITFAASPQIIQTPRIQEIASTTQAGVPDVPFFSQFKDIQSPKWQKVGCGITSLAMVIDFYQPHATSVNTLLKKGITAGAYDPNAGWIYQGLIELSRKYGLDGVYHDLSKLNKDVAFTKFKSYLKEGPVILAVHHKFDPASTIPHLVVINGIDNDIIYYNDPASNKGEKQISITDFLSGWKKKVIVIRPIVKVTEIAFAER